MKSTFSAFSLLFAISASAFQLTPVSSLLKAYDGIKPNGGDHLAVYGTTRVHLRHWNVSLLQHDLFDVQLNRFIDLLGDSVQSVSEDGSLAVAKAFQGYQSNAIWDLNKNAVLFRSSLDLLFTPNQKFVWEIIGSHLVVLESRTGALVLDGTLKLHELNFGSDMSRDGKLITGFSNHDEAIMELPSGRVICKLPKGDWERRLVRFSSDDKTVTSRSTGDDGPRELALVDVSNCSTKIFKFPHGLIDVSPDAKVGIAYGLNRLSYEVFNLETGKVVFAIPLKESFHSSIEFSRDSARMVVISNAIDASDVTPAKAMIYELKTGTVIYGAEAPRNSRFGFSTDLKFDCPSVGGRAQLHDIETDAFYDLNAAANASSSACRFAEHDALIAVESTDGVVLWRYSRDP